AVPAAAVLRAWIARLEFPGKMDSRPGDISGASARTWLGLLYHFDRLYPGVPRNRHAARRGAGRGVPEAQVGEFLSRPGGDPLTDHPRLLPQDTSPYRGCPDRRT